MSVFTIFILFFLVCERKQKYENRCLCKTKTHHRDVNNIHFNLKIEIQSGIGKEEENEIRPLVQFHLWFY